MDKATVCRDMGREDYNDLTEAQQLNGDVYFIQGVDASAFAPTNSLWNKVGTTPLDSDLPADCSQAINEIKSNLTQLLELDYNNSESIPNVSAFTPTKCGIIFSYGITGAYNNDAYICICDGGNLDLTKMINRIGAYQSSVNIAMQTFVSKGHAYYCASNHASDVTHTFVPFKLQ